MRTLGGNDAADPQTLVNAYFRGAASYWAEIYECAGVKEAVHQERLRAALAMVDTLQLSPQARVLDVGCGAGYATVALARRGFIVDAIDTLQVMVDATRDLAIGTEAQSRVRSQLGDVHALPFPNNAFVLVLALGVLPWLPALDKPLREMARVLRPGGCLIVSVDNRWGLRQFLDPLTNPLLRPPRKLIGQVLRAYSQYAPVARSQLTSLRTFRTALAAQGLEELHGVALGFGPFTLFNREILPWSTGMKLHNWLQRLADRGIPILCSSGSQHLVLAKKRSVVIGEGMASH